MKTEIIVAIIGATAVIAGAVITGIFTLLKKDKTNETKIKQKQKGNHNTQIGIQNSYEGENDD